MLPCDEMQRSCLHPSRPRARLDGWVYSTTGVLRPEGGTMDVIDMEEYPATAAGRAEALEWCSPCGHLFYAENIRRWMRGRVDPRCPECHGKISELIPYGMTLADLQARRAAEAAAAQARVAVARHEYEPRRVEMIRERLRDEQDIDRCVQELRAILDEIERYRVAEGRCGNVRRDRVNTRSVRLLVLRAEGRVCSSGGHVSHIHEAILREYIQNLRTIVHLCTSADDRWQMAFAMNRGVTIEEADGFYRGVLAEVGTRRTQNIGLLAYLVAIRDGQPHMLNAAAYVAFRDDMEARGAGIYATERHASALRGFVLNLEGMDRMRGYAKLPPRPAGQTVAEFLATVGRV